jgi:hypothetical protein
MGNKFVSDIVKLEKYFHKGNSFWIFLFMYVIQHCFICRPSDSAESEDAGIEPRTVATLALTANWSNHSATSYPPFHS